MTKLKKIGLSLSGLASLYIAYITGTGDILNYINFADNNISVMCFISAFSSDSVPCSKELDMEWANESENIQ